MEGRGGDGQQLIHSFIHPFSPYFSFHVADITSAVFLRRKIFQALYGISSSSRTLAWNLSFLSSSSSSLLNASYYSTIIHLVWISPQAGMRIEKRGWRRTSEHTFFLFCLYLTSAHLYAAEFGDGLDDIHTRQCKSMPVNASQPPSTSVNLSQPQSTPINIGQHQSTSVNTSQHKSTSVNASQRQSTVGVLFFFFSFFPSFFVLFSYVLVLCSSPRIYFYQQQQRGGFTGWR